MQFLIKTMFIVLSFALVILPQQTLASKILDKNCCTETFTKKDCCKKNQNPTKHDTNGNCEKNCAICSLIALNIAFFIKNTSVELSVKRDFKETNLIFSTPQFLILDPNFSIWQPPKLS